MAAGAQVSVASVRPGDVCRNEKGGDTPSLAPWFSHTQNRDEGSISLESFWGDSGRDAQPLASTRQGADGMIFIQEGTNVTGLALGSGSTSKVCAEPTPGWGPWMKNRYPKSGPRLASLETLPAGGWEAGWCLQPFWAQTHWGSYPTLPLGIQ